MIKKNRNTLELAQTFTAEFGEEDDDTCFANPGTSEMHLIAAIDKHFNAANSLFV